MEDFEFLRHVTIGQYIPGDSLIHRLDARTKLTAAVLLTLAISFNLSYIANVILLICSFALVIISGISLRYMLGGLKPALPLIIALAVLQLLFYGENFHIPHRETMTIFKWGIVHITTASVQLVIISSLRFLQLLFLTSLLTNTTPVTELSRGAENMLRPFNRIGVPAHEMAMVLTIALRFVPIFAEQLEVIMKAQAARGANWAARGRWRFVQTTRQMLVLIVPLFIDALRRGEDLILAMEARCYTGGRGRTNLLRLEFARRDLIALPIVVIFTVVMIAARNWFPF